ncbi:hypothetical protein ABZ154_32630 [Streptomyces sp. NPDC006261]|uniref:hypothetical protein n=1 Tax=Streptomyces sp. NPDC006261 TaxID=3156739 RepID=UPI0033AA6E16
MATESDGTGTTGGAAPLIRGLLGRLAAPDGPGQAKDGLGCGERGAGDFLPDLPDPKLLALLGAYHCRGVQVGFPELTDTST